MASVEKVAVSLDRELLRKAEKLREATGESRSALVARALAQLLAEQQHRERIERYVDGYRRLPERRIEIEAARAMARRSLEALPWDDE